MYIELVLLVAANVVKWLGVALNLYCAGFALFALATYQRFSDGVADAVPMLLAGALALSLALSLSWTIRGVVRRRRRTGQG